MIDYVIETPYGYQTPQQYAISVNFGLSSEQFRYWVSRHSRAYLSKLKNFDCAWVEGMFTELNYHEEVKDLQNHNYTKLLK